MERTKVGAAVAVLAVTLSLTLGCGGGEEPTDSAACLGDPAVDASAPVTRIDVHFMAGNQPLLPGKELTSANGATFKPSKARLYLSELALISESGERVAAELVDEGGERVPYALTLVDFEHPESMSLQLRAPAGTYRGLAVSVGVPETCATGAKLNHSDASAMEAPLDVDSDMYWSWDPGYVFLKFEGQVRDGNDWSGFFFHTGEKERFAKLELDWPFTITADGGTGPELIADFNQLLVSPDGLSEPDITDPDAREVHSGEGADQLARNVRGSHFLTLTSGHQ